MSNKRKRCIPENSQDSFKFFQAQVSDYKEVGFSVFVGKDENGIKGIRKIKFKE